mmetsp:Transcript_40068/g.103707  ORF Transcript_40068/g.103707 Transcript_40068/m.103707 type:complete len:88 (+) Transcript_40068:2506-2769(+)
MPVRARGHVRIGSRLSTFRVCPLYICLQWLVQKHCFAQTCNNTRRSATRLSLVQTDTTLNPFFFSSTSGMRLPDVIDTLLPPYRWNE